MVLSQNALKSSIFSHSKCYKKHVYEGNYLRLGTSVKFFRHLPGKSHVMAFFTFSSWDHFSSLTTETDIHLTIKFR